ncbi:MAG: DNA repair protein RadC [Gemmatimonadota bacterium]|nr:DNA repair protein RadC [Gemmatimonadota bacterium]
MLHHDRPRERLCRLGPAALSDADLLVLLIGSGTAHAPGPAIAAKLLVRFEAPRRLASADVSALESVDGVGRATSARLVAAFELARRAASQAPPPDAPIRGPADVFKIMGPRLRDRPLEEFHALLLNTRHRVLRAVLVTRGILDAALIHPREVFRLAVGEGAAGVILVHNHPSGDPAPSAEDRAVTRQLGEAGRTLGIPVLDHVIVAQGGYTSLASDLGR